MREILFRGKTVKGERWFEGSLLIYPDGEAYICVDTSDSNVLDKYHVIPETIGQYTGLKDKNGRRIFEWDIVLIDDIPAYVGSRNGKWVFFEKDGGCYILFEYISKCRVIGNIYDNLELLKGGAAE